MADRTAILYEKFLKAALENGVRPMQKLCSFCAKGWIWLSRMSTALTSNKAKLGWSLSGYRSLLKNQPASTPASATIAVKA